METALMILITILMIFFLGWFVCYEIQEQREFKKILEQLRYEETLNDISDVLKEKVTKTIKLEKIEKILKILKNKCQTIKIIKKRK